MRSCQRMEKRLRSGFIEFVGNVDVRTGKRYPMPLQDSSCGTVGS